MLKAYCILLGYHQFPNGLEHGFPTLRVIGVFDPNTWKILTLVITDLTKASIMIIYATSCPENWDFTYFSLSFFRKLTLTIPIAFLFFHANLITSI